MSDAHTFKYGRFEDPSGCLSRLGDALRQPHLKVFEGVGEVTSKARRAAYWVAVALGECHLFGVKPPDDIDGTLSDPMALAAADELVEFVDTWTDEAGSLGERFEQSEPIEGEEMCVSLVERRLEAWAAFVAIDEAYAAATDERTEVLPQFSQAVDKLLAALCEFDSVLFGQRELLSIAAGTNLLENWRRMLAPEFREVGPWLLDGALEAKAKECKDLVLICLKRPDLWKELVAKPTKSRADSERTVVPFGEDKGHPITKDESHVLCKSILARRRRPIVKTWPQVHVAESIAAGAKSEGGMLRAQRVEFVAEDGSWRAWMDIPSSVLDPDEKLSLWVNDYRDAPIREGEVVLYGEKFRIDDGRVLIALSELRRLQEKSAQIDTICLLHGGRQSIGRVIKDKEREPGDDQS
jgi:hypothetical protein